MQLAELPLPSTADPGFCADGEHSLPFCLYLESKDNFSYGFSYVFLLSKALAVIDEAA